MSKYEQDERAKELMDEHNGNAYSLARRVAELEDELKKPQ